MQQRTLASSKWSGLTAIVAPSLWVLQSVHGSIHTVINGCEEKGEQRGGWNNVPPFQPGVNGPTRD